MALVYIGLGANLGDRLATLRAAVRDLAEFGAVVARSSIWETEPIGPPPDYLNAAVVLDLGPPLDDEPLALLDALQAIERAHGRQRGLARDTPRTLDLDLLLWDGRVLDLPRLRVPHPRLHERGFVLEPLAEVAGPRIHPLLQCSIELLRDQLPRGRRVRRLIEAL